jgi:ParB family chromosome partitioning protein
MLSAIAQDADVRIDAEFAALIPPLTEDEQRQLEANLLADGCRDPLVVWQEQGVLLDGHNRYRICQEHRIAFDVRKVALPHRSAAKVWVIRNQLGRRNLTPDQASYLRGLEYEATKRAAHRPAKGGQNVPLKTAKHLGKAHGVAARTIKRDAAFAKAVDSLEAGAAPGIKARVLSGDGPPRAAVVEAARIAKTEPKRAAAMLSAPKPHVSQNSGDHEWYTPAEYIRAACAVMGGIDLDPASTAEANEVVGASQFFSQEQDGLKQQWKGRVWLNPPYASGLVERFTGKLMDAISSGEVSEAFVLVNNSTETRWFQRLFSAAEGVCFPAGRVKFWHPRKVAVPLQGQALLYFGKNWDGFTEQFEHFGVLCFVARSGERF